MSRGLFVSAALAACAGCVALGANLDASNNATFTEVGDSAQSVMRGVLPLNAPWEARQAYYNGSWAGFDPATWKPVDNSGLFCSCMCPQQPDSMFPSNSTDWSIPYGDNDDRFYNYTGGDWFGNVTGWNSTNGEYDGFYNFTGKDFMPGGYGEYDTPWPQANGSASGEPPYGDQPPFGSYGGMEPAPAPYRDGYEVDMPGLCICPCNATEGPAMAPRPAMDLGITDMATLCTMYPEAKECEPEPPKDLEAIVTFKWHMLQLPKDSCVAPQDRHGFCGNMSASVTAEIVCQELSISADGTVQLIRPVVEAETVKMVLEKLAEYKAAGGATALSAGDVATDGMGGRRRLQEPENIQEILEAYSKREIVNLCTDDKAPSVESRSFKCAQRPCEVLQLHKRYIGGCYSMDDMPCGPMKILSEARCYSPYEGRYFDQDVDHDEVVGSPCAAVDGRLPMGTTLEECPEPEKPCPSEAFYQYSPWQECSASCSDPTCVGKARCTVTGTRSRNVRCVKLVSGVLTDSNDCDENTKEPSDNQPCSVQCFQSIRHRKVIGECSQPCGPGTRTTTFVLCQPGDVGCAAVDSTDPKEEACEIAKCNPCEDFCVAENTASENINLETYTCTCTCKENFAGRRCHRSTAVDAPAPAVYDRDGKACPSGTLDSGGTCCTGKLDMCGLCEGGTYAGFGTVRVGLDSNGVCCSGETGVFLTGDFTCCPGPQFLDECGVCNGGGSTCRKSAAADISRASGISVAAFAAAIKSKLPSGVTMFALDSAGTEQNLSSGRRLQQASMETYGIMPSSVGVSSGQISAKFFSIGQDPAFTSPLLAGFPTPGVTGTANNGVCENGEPSGSNDCPTPQTCPLPSMEVGASMIIGDPTTSCGGNGVCNSITGTCMCSAGYTGSACHICNTAAFYAEVEVAGQWACSRLANDQLDAPEVPAGNPPPAGPVVPQPPSVPDGPGTTPPDGSMLDAEDEKEKKGLGQVATALIIIGCLIVFVLFAGVTYCILHRRRAREVGPA